MHAFSPTVWGFNFIQRFCRAIGRTTTAILPKKARDELTENLLQNLHYKFPPQTVERNPGATLFAHMRARGETYGPCHTVYAQNFLLLRNDTNIIMHLWPNSSFQKTYYKTFPTSFDHRQKREIGSNSPRTYAQVDM